MSKEKSKKIKQAANRFASELQRYDDLERNRDMLEDTRKKLEKDKIDASGIRANIDLIASQMDGIMDVYFPVAQEYFSGRRYAKEYLARKQPGTRTAEPVPSVQPAPQKPAAKREKHPITGEKYDEHGLLEGSARHYAMKAAKELFEETKKNKTPVTKESVVEKVLSYGMDFDYETVFGAVGALTQAGYLTNVGPTAKRLAILVPKGEKNPFTKEEARAIQDKRWKEGAKEALEKSKETRQANKTEPYNWEKAADVLDEMSRDLNNVVTTELVRDAFNKRYKTDVDTHIIGSYLRNAKEKGRAENVKIDEVNVRWLSKDAAEKLKKSETSVAKPEEKAPVIQNDIRTDFSISQTKTEESDLGTFAAKAKEFEITLFEFERTKNPQLREKAREALSELRAMEPLAESMGVKLGPYQPYESLFQQSIPVNKVTPTDIIKSMAPEQKEQLDLISTALSEGHTGFESMRNFLTQYSDRGKKFSANGSTLKNALTTFEKMGILKKGKEGFSKVGQW